MKPAPPTLTTRESWALRCVYAVTLLVLVVALTNAFEHAKDWHDRHIHASYWWQGWAFAVIIELPALMGLLLMMVFPKIAPGVKPTIPRALFLGAVAVSICVQQAYAGSDASGTVRIIVIVPSIFAGIFIELFFWLLDKVEKFKNGTLFIDTPAPPTLVPPPPIVIPAAPAPVSHQPPAAAVPGHDSQDTDTKPHVSPWTSPPAGRDMSPDITPDTAPDVPETSGVGHGDNQQVTALVPPPHVPPTEQDVDTDVPPAGQGDTSLDDPPDMSGDTEDTDGGTPDDQGDTDADVPDDDQDTDMDTNGGDRGIDPRAVEALDMRTKGMTNGKIAAHFGVSTKTVSRWVGKAAPAQAVNSKTPELTTTH